MPGIDPSRGNLPAEVALEAYPDSQRGPLVRKITHGVRYSHATPDPIRSNHNRGWTRFSAPNMM